MVNKKKVAAIIAVNELFENNYLKQEKVNWSEKRVGWIYNKDNPFKKI